MPYELSDDGLCVRKKGGENIKCHKTHADALAHLRALEANVNYILDKFVSTKPGEPYRLLPFGKITRGGVMHEITPEYAAQFKLPPFKAPIKLGSHEDETPAGGHLIRLEVREDGLYGYPEFTEKGTRAFNDGDYRYHSPEVIWDGGALETSDGVIDGPLIIGDALLHHPYLGESTAFYSVKENDMTQEYVQVPKSFWENLLNAFKPKQEEPPVTEPPAPDLKPEEFKAAVKERDDYKAQLDALKAEQAAKALRADLAAQLQDKEKFGSMYVELKTAEEAATMMSGMTPEQREWCMRNFSALIAQVNESKLFGEHGSETAPPIGADPKAEFNAQVEAIRREKSIDYNAALELAKISHSDLFTAAFGRKEKK